jgi:hypothetical protein
MDNHPIAFFYCNANGLFEAKQWTCLFSNNHTTHAKQSSYTNGVFIYKTNTDSIRRSIALFSARSLPKHNWINDNNKFIGRE